MTRLLCLAFGVLLLSTPALAAPPEGKKLILPTKKYVTRTVAYRVPSLVSRRRVKVEKTQQVYADDDLSIIRVDYSFAGVVTQDTIRPLGDYRCRRRVEGRYTHRLYGTGFTIGDKVAFKGHAIFVLQKSRRRWQSISNQPTRNEEYERLMGRHYRASDTVLMEGSEKAATLKAACRFRPYDR